MPQGCDFTAVGGRTGEKRDCAAEDAKATCSVPLCPVPEQKAGCSASDSGMACKDVNQVLRPGFQSRPLPGLGCGITVILSLF